MNFKGFYAGLLRSSPNSFNHALCADLGKLSAAAAVGITGIYIDCMVGRSLCDQAKLDRQSGKRIGLFFCLRAACHALTNPYLAVTLARWQWLSNLTGLDGNKKMSKNTKRANAVIERPIA